MKRLREVFRQGNSGQVLVGAITALLIIAIFMPLIITYVRQEARWATKQRRTTNAFHLAEAAVDRGVWKLTESDQVWKDAKDGVPVDGYTGVQEYSDIAGGKYKIAFAPGPHSGEVTVIGKGRDTSTNEMRTVEAVYTKAAINAGLQVEGAMGYDPNLRVHWGPVVTFSSIDQNPSDYFPRKYSKGRIVGRDTVNDSNNSDNKEYWAFSKDLGTPPIVDLPYYKTVALASKIPTISGGGELRQGSGSAVAIASPTGSGSGFFLLSQNGNSMKTFGDYIFRCTTCAIYIDNDTGASRQFDLSQGTFLELEALILAGNHGLNNNARGYDNYMSTVPVDAPLEYQHASVPAGDKPGLITPGPGNCCYEIDDLGLKGFIFAGGGSVNAGANTNVIGVIDMLGTLGNMNVTTIYFDKEIAEAIKLKAGSPRRISWREIKTTWN